MGRPSNIDRLDPEIREEIGRLRDAGRTIDEIMACLRSLGVDEVSRSGLGRHIQGLDRLSERLLRGRTISEALIRKLGDAPESRQARLNIELMHTIITDLMMSLSEQGEEGQPVMLDPKQVQLLTRALADLAQASKGDVDLTVRIRREIEAEQKAKLAKLETEAAKSPDASKRGFDPETLRRVRSEIYGLPT